MRCYRIAKKCKQLNKNIALLSVFYPSFFKILPDWNFTFICSFCQMRLAFIGVTGKRWESTVWKMDYKSGNTLSLADLLASKVPYRYRLTHYSVITQWHVCVQELPNSMWHAYIEIYRGGIYHWKSLELYKTKRQCTYSILHTSRAFSSFVPGSTIREQLSLLLSNPVKLMVNP